MQPITHQEVRALLQAAADVPLPAAQQAAVDAHLGECRDCRAFAARLEVLQDGLRRVTRLHWDRQPAPLPLQAIKERSGRVKRRKQINETLGKFAVVPLLAFAFVLAVRMVAPQQLAAGTAVLTIQTPQLALRTPTPVYQNTSDGPDTVVCQRLVYIVQPGDTLDGIAAHFGVPQETILAYNGLASDKLQPNTTLNIPLCGHTPTGTSTATADSVSTPALDTGSATAPPG